MATYIAHIRQGEEMTEFARGSEEAPIRAALEAELNKRYPANWIRFNEHQYTHPGAIMGTSDPVLAVVIDHYSELEVLQQQRDLWRAKIERLESELAEAKEHAQGYDEMIAEYK